MIINNIKLFSQNVRKNKLLTDMILESNKDFDIIFIQELPWSFIQSISSSSNEKGDSLVGASNHSNWVTFAKSPLNNNDSPRVILYINAQLSYFRFSLQNDIYNHKDICCFFFFNNSDIFYMINVYSDSNQSALKYFKNTEANIQNVLIMTGDFNIKDNNYDSLFLFHSIHSDLLTDIMDSLDLFLSNSTNQVPTRYSDNANDSNLVIDLTFLRPNSLEIDNHTIHPDL